MSGKLAPKHTYKGISFARGLSMPFAEFKQTFGKLEAFKVVPHLERDKELKRVHAGLESHTKKVKEEEKKASKND